MTSNINYIVFDLKENSILDQDEDTIILGVKSFTIISGRAIGVDSEAEKLARHHGLNVKVLIPPCHPRSKTMTPLTKQQLAEAIPITQQVAATLNKRLESLIRLQNIHRNYHVVNKQT